MMHYDHLRHVCEALEQAEEPFCSEARLFKAGSLSFEALKQGYESHESYKYLSGHHTGQKASVDASMELQTILNPQSEKVGLILDRLQKGYQEKTEGS